MPKPAAYCPEEGYKYQILERNPAYSRAWDHCDYAKDRTEKDHLLKNYRQAYPVGWQFKVIILPYKYWPKPEPTPPALFQDAYLEGILAKLDR